MENISKGEPQLVHSYLIRAINSELIGDRENAIIIINEAINEFPDNAELKTFSNCLNARLTNFASGPQRNMEGYFIFAHGMYKLEISNIFESKVCYSFINTRSGNYLRHRFGKLLESAYEDKDLFRFDSSFIVYMTNENKICLRCSNIGLTNMFVTGKNDLSIAVFDGNNFSELAQFDVFRKI